MPLFAILVPLGEHKLKKNIHFDSVVSHTQKLVTAAVTTLTFGALLTQASFAQSEQKVDPSATGVRRKAAATETQPTISMPAPGGMVMLLRSTLAALNHANQTENYSVLYAMAGPQLQKNTTPEKMKQAFAPFREQNLDLSSTALLAPEFSQMPQIDGQGILRMVGFFPTKPLQVNFNMAYRLIDGKWHPEAIGVDATPPDPMKEIPQSQARGSAASVQDAAAQQSANPPARKKVNKPASDWNGAPDLPLRGYPPGSTNKY